MNCELCGRVCEWRTANTCICQCGGGAILYYFYNKSSFIINSPEGYIKHIIISYDKHDDYYIFNGTNIYYIEQNYRLHDNYYNCALYYASNNESKFIITNNIPHLPTKQLVEYCKSILLFT